MSWSSSSPYDIHNTLIAAGPAFREHATSDAPTGNVDLAPTLLSLLGSPVPSTMTGRVIEEAMRSRAAQPSAAVSRVTETAKTPDGRYEVTAALSVFAGRCYLDFTQVTRK